MINDKEDDNDPDNFDAYQRKKNPYEVFFSEPLKNKKNFEKYCGYCDMNLEEPLEFHV
jgi:hypothetical protein